MESVNAHSDSNKQGTIQSAVDALHTSTSKAKEANSTTVDSTSTSGATTEPNSLDGPPKSPTKVNEKSTDSYENDVRAILAATRSHVTSVDTTTVEKVAEPTSEDGQAMEPPAKRQKTNEASSESGEPVVPTADVASAAEVKVTLPASSSSTFVKPVVTNNNNNNHAPSSTSTSQLLLPDYAALRQTVQDLLNLLQLYGPLTANQLEYNLPPVVPTSIPWSVHDVLSILVAIGLVQHVKGTADQFCIFGGIPRATAIYPTEIPLEIQRAINEAEESYKRCQIIREALRQTNTTTNNNHNGSDETTKNYVDVLKHLLQEYPSITNDPVYWTALRNCHIDMGSGTSSLPLAERRSNTAPKSNKGSSSTNTKEGGKSNKAPKGTSAESLGNKVITEKKAVVTTSSVSKVAQISSKATASEKQLTATLKDGPSPLSLPITPAAANTESASSKVLETVQKTVETKVNQPTTQEEAFAVTISATDALTPKIFAETSSVDAVIENKSA